MEVEAVTGMPDTLAEVATIADIIMAAIGDTITGDMHRGEPYSEFFSAERSLEASTVRIGGPTTRCRYSRPIMIHTINIPTLHLPMCLRFRPPTPLPLIRRDLLQR